MIDDEVRPRRGALPNDYVRGGLLHGDVASEEPDVKPTRRGLQSGGSLTMICFMGCAAVLIMLVSAWVLNGFSPSGITFGIGTPHAVAGGTPHASAPNSATPFAAVQPSTPSWPSFPGLPPVIPSASPSRSAAPAPPPAPNDVDVTATLSTSPTATASNSSSSSSNSPASSGTATSSSPTPPPTSPTVQPPDPADALPANAPGSSFGVGSLDIAASNATQVGGTGTSPSGFTVTLTGLKPTGQVAPTSSNINWGDPTYPTPDPLTPDPTDGTYGAHHTYPYTEVGPHTIQWTYTTDRAHIWTHSIMLSTTNTPAPAPQVITSTDINGTPLFLLSDLNSTPWSSWLTDSTSGSAASSTTDPVVLPVDMTQLYAGGVPPSGLLTVIGTDGQLVRVPWPTPMPSPTP